MVRLPFPNVMPVNRGCETTSYVRVYRLRATRVAQALQIHDSPFSQRKQSGSTPSSPSFHLTPSFWASLSDPSLPTAPRPAPEHPRGTLTENPTWSRLYLPRISAKGVVSTSWPIERWPARSRRGPSSSLNLVPLRRISPASLSPSSRRLPPLTNAVTGFRGPASREDAPLVLAGIS